MSLPDRQICNAIFEEICVLANGEVVCSCGDPAGQKVYGNIRDQLLSEIFSNRSYRGMRRYQLNTAPSCYCPTLGTNCGGRVYKANQLHTERGLAIRKLQLEPTSHCNLDCPECPVHIFTSHPAYRPNRKDKLQLEEMLDVVRQLPSLKLLLYYNFGEPFLHAQSIEFFRGAKAIRPGLRIETSTNGIPLTKDAMDAIASERLLDSILFSIDGVNQASYEKYRRKGILERAFNNMVNMREAIARHGAEKDIRIEWQYILFEWNDSDEELEAASRLSRLHDIPIKWVLTHTPGKSRRFTYGSTAYARLVESAKGYQGLSCELQGQDMADHGLKGGIYSQEIKYTNFEYTGSVLSMDVAVRNVSSGKWEKTEKHPFCLGLRVLDRDGDILSEQTITRLNGTLAPGETTNFHLEYPLSLPDKAQYIQLDMVHGWICWFQTRGASTLIIPLEDAIPARSM